MNDKIPTDHSYHDAVQIVCLPDYNIGKGYSKYMYVCIISA